MLTPTEHTHYGYDSLQLTSVTYSTPGANAFDDFQSGNFTGGTGWPAAWLNTGSPSVVSSGGAKYANLDTTDAMTRSVSVSGTITRLQYKARATSLESGEFGYVEVSPDGTNWTALKTFDTNNDDNVWRTYEHDVSAYEDSGTLYVRFRIAGSASNDDFEVDDVSVVWGSERDTYTYDAVGNRLTKNATSYTYGNADQMLTADGVSYGYDARGNQTSRGSDTFTFDHENRMTGATIGGNSSSYVYNGDGVRVGKTVGSVTTNYVQDVASSLPVVVQDGNYSYVYGIGLISMTDGAGVQIYRLTDGLGSTSELVDGSGNVIVGYTYDAFGGVRSQSASSGNDWLFTGEQRDDESGYDFLRARYYDPAVGRFMGRDPLEHNPNLPTTLNDFVYALNGPVLLGDPSGMCAICLKIRLPCLLICGGTPQNIASATASAVAGAAASLLPTPSEVACQMLPGNCLVESLLNSVGLTLGYADLSGTACAPWLGCGVVGVQFAFLGAPHPYGGGGFGTGGSISYNIAPFQTVTTGVSCQFTITLATAVGTDGQIGQAGIVYDETGYPMGTVFVEAGVTIGGPGWSNTCVYIF